LVSAAADCCGLAQRARIVLLADEGDSNGEVARRLGCTAATVSKWRGRFVQQGPEGLSDEYRPGSPRMIGDERVEEVIAKTLDELRVDALVDAVHGQSGGTVPADDQPHLAGVRAAPASL
jgi:transposase